MNIRSALFLTATFALFASGAEAASVSLNTGSLGAAANGTNAASVAERLGVVTAGADIAVLYNGTAGTNTTVPFLPALNPAASSPFTIEFWANPTASDNDDSPLSNRVSAGNRSGWAFFQRDAATGWNFRMYNGNGSALGWDLTGGTAPLNLWSHVVVTWNGSAALLYVNGTLADSSNDPALNGVYNPNTTAGTNLIAAATDSGSPYAGGIDEVAFYGSALSPTQILNHFNTVTSPTAGAYYTMVRNDGALLQLSNVPEPSSAALIALAGLALCGRRSRERGA